MIKCGVYVTARLWYMYISHTCTYRRCVLLAKNGCYKDDIQPHALIWISNIDQPLCIHTFNSKINFLGTKHKLGKSFHIEKPLTMALVIYTVGKRVKMTFVGLKFNSKLFLALICKKIQICICINVKCARLQHVSSDHYLKAFLIALKVKSTPRKSVNLDHSTVQSLILHACLYMRNLNI